LIFVVISHELFHQQIKSVVVREFIIPIVIVVVIAAVRKKQIYDDEMRNKNPN
jgi:hypothetical protein